MNTTRRLVLALALVLAIVISGAIALNTVSAEGPVAEAPVVVPERGMGMIPSTGGGIKGAELLSNEIAATSLPAAVDLTRYDLPIGNQRSQSSCVAWAVGYYYKSYQEARENNWSLSETRHQFSPAFIYNQINGGQDKGTSIRSAMELLKTSGATDLEMMPWYSNDFTTQPNDRQNEAAKPYKATATKDTYAGRLWSGAGKGNVDEVRTRLATGDPVVLGLKVYGNFYHCSGDWVGVPAANETFYGNHAVCAVGYDDARGGVKIVNSWGAGWGASGYTYLSYDFIRNYVIEAWTMEDAPSAPMISGISPDTGTVGTTMTITGTNFGVMRNSATVRFCNTPASVISWSNDRVIVTVPAGVSSCQVTVSNYAGLTSNGVPFTGGASLFGVVPSAATPGDLVTIRGAQLGTAGTLKWGNKTVSTKSWSDTEITFVAPEGTGTGSLSASVGQLTSNQVQFEVCNSIWYLAEGSTAGGFETWILVQNPNNKAASISITYMTPSGTVQGPRNLTLPANSRQTFNVASTLPNAWDVSTRVTSSENIIVERSMYGSGRSWGSESVGVTGGSTSWYLAEGSTANGFETWVLVQNPNGFATDVRLTYLTPTGKVPGPFVTVPANARQSFNVADVLNGADQVSITVEADEAVIAERSVYWNGRKGAHNTVGVEEGSTEWYLAEGSTAGGFETWIPVANPGTKDAKVTLSYMTTKGEVKGPTVTVKAGTRRSFYAADTVPNEWSVSTKVTSDRPVVAEKSVYWANRLEGTNSIGVRGAATRWDLAEGCTAQGYETWVLLQNPGNKDAKVAVTYMTTKGEVKGPTVTVKGNSRMTLHVADTVNNEWSVSTRVASDVPVIAERSMYGANRSWGHGSVGVPDI